MHDDEHEPRNVCTTNNIIRSLSQLSSMVPLSTSPTSSDAAASGLADEEQRRIIVKVKSRTSEMYPEVKETDKVRDLVKIIEQAWSNDPMILRHNGVVMQSDLPLSVYNVRDGSVLKVSVLAEPPHRQPVSIQFNSFILKFSTFTIRLYCLRICIIYSM